MKDGQLQIFALTLAEINETFDPQLFRQSGFTGLMLGATTNYEPQLYGSPGQFNWGIHGYGHATYVQHAKLPWFKTLKSWSYLDEQDLTNPAVFQDTVNWFNSMRTDPRVKDVILYTNQYGAQIPENTLRQYMASAKPDMLMFDYYTWGTQYPWLYSNGSPAAIYKSLAKYRRLSVAGHDGTGRNPIPFGKWMQTWTTLIDHGPGSQQLGYRMSESELRLDQFAGWAFGAKFASAFTYDSFEDMDARVGPLLFDQGGPAAQPTSEFYQLARINRESRALGPSLLALVSTDVRMMYGPNSWPDIDVQPFDGTSDPFLKSVIAANLGSTNGGARGDVVLGWFTPLLERFQSSEPEDDTYFMVVNGLTWPDASAAETMQWIRLHFDMGETGVTALQRLSRLTGEVELVPLVHDGGSLYHLDLFMPGGTGDLFKYYTGVEFATVSKSLYGLKPQDFGVGQPVPEPAAAAFTAFGGAALALRRASRRRT